MYEFLFALVKFGGGVSQMSGKLGGTVFARNKGGAYARNFVKPINPNTTKQQDVRAEFALLVSSWKDLTKVQQQLWEDMAPQYPYSNRLGEASVRTGQGLYIHLNMNLQVVGATILTEPLVPETFSNTKVGSLALVLTAGALTTGNLVLTAIGASTESVIIEVTTSLSGGITKPAKGLFRQVQIETDASASATIDVKTAYIALFGSPQLNTNVFVRAFLVNENTGQRLNLGQSSTIVSGT